MNIEKYRRVCQITIFRSIGLEMTRVKKILNVTYSKSCSCKVEKVESDRCSRACDPWEHWLSLQLKALRWRAF